MNNQSTCRICGKPLSDPVSVSRGIGPECYQSYKAKDYQDKTGNLFANRAEFDWGVDNGVLWIEDKGGARSVTNDMDEVLADIANVLRGEIKALKIMYRDSMGIWDGVTANFDICEDGGNFRYDKRGARVSGVEFFSLNQKEKKAARIALVFRTALPTARVYTHAFPN